MRRLRARLRRPVEWRYREAIARLDDVAARLGRLESAAARLDEGEARMHASIEELTRQVREELSPALRTVVTEEAANRRRLHAAREDPGYASAFEDADPLVSVVIPAVGPPELLVERALPSALAQTHERLEVVVVSDGPSEVIRDAVAAVGDRRVRFAATTHRVVDPDPARHWLVASALPRNHGAWLARGAWVADLDHDDALRPDSVERLLTLARAERAEVAYGPLLMHLPGGREEVLASFPPVYGQFGWQGSIVHAGLRFFERELVAAAYGLAGDYFRALRMLRVGVRFAHTTEATCDFYPSRAWSSAGAQDGVADTVDVPPGDPAVERQGEQ